MENKYAIEYANDKQKIYCGDLTEREMMLIKGAYKSGYQKGKDIPKKKIFNVPSFEMINDMKCLYGIPPYDGGDNTTRGDNYFGKSLRKKIEKAGCGWDEVLKIAREEGRKAKPHWDE